MGLERGGFCVGSSWALMAALFALGVIKLSPWNAIAIGATAVVIAALALAVAFAPGQVPGLTMPA
jgi:predicted metal-binding membrane protein